MICIYEMHLLIILLAHLHMLMSFYDVKSRLKCNIFCPRSKVFLFWWMGVIISNDFNIMYSNALSNFMFETNCLKIIVIWFINWSQAFKLPRRHDLFFTKSHEIPKISIYIWFQNGNDTQEFQLSYGLNLKILTRKKLCNFVQLGGKFGGIFYKTIPSIFKNLENYKTI